VPCWASAMPYWADAMPGQCHAGPVPCRASAMRRTQPYPQGKASAMLSRCHAGQVPCGPVPCRASAMPGQCRAPHSALPARQGRHDAARRGTCPTSAPICAQQPMCGARCTDTGTGMHSTAGRQSLPACRPVPCRASAMLGQCDAGQGPCRASAMRASAMPGQCHARQCHAGPVPGGRGAQHRRACRHATAPTCSPCRG
jgi:hypothetical protein